jgi:hypothetical protein
MAIDPNAIFSGAPVILTFNGVACGATTAVPKYTAEMEKGSPKFTNAGGAVKGTVRIRGGVPSVEVQVNEQTAQKLAWAHPGCTATSSESVGVPGAAAGGGTLATTFGADPAAGATTVKLASVTALVAGDFVRIGDAGAAATEANSEIVRIVTVGTAGGLDTIVENSAGGGIIANFDNADEVKTIIGSILSAPAAAGAVNVKIDYATGMTPGDFVRIGDAGHYETRALTAVGSVGPSGAGLTFAVPLTRDHGLDSWCVKVAAQGGTRIRPVLGLIPDSAYADLVLVDVGADGRTFTLTIENAMSAESQSMDFSDDPANPLGLALKFTGHYDPATPMVFPAYYDLEDAAV